MRTFKVNIRWGSKSPIERDSFEGEGKSIVAYSIGNTVHVRRRCGLLSNYFDHLLLLLVLLVFIQAPYPGRPWFILQRQWADSRTGEVDNVALTSRPVRLGHVTEARRKRTSSASRDRDDSAGPDRAPTGSRPRPRALRGPGSRRRTAASCMRRRTPLATPSSRKSRDLSTGARCCSSSSRSCRPAARRASAQRRRRGRTTGSHSGTRSRDSCAHTHTHTHTYV